MVKYTVTIFDNHGEVEVYGFFGVKHALRTFDNATRQPFYTRVVLDRVEA